MTIVVPALLGDNVVQFTMHTEAKFFASSFYLRALVSGPYTVQARRLSDGLVIGGAINFLTSGLKSFSNFVEYFKPGEIVAYDVTALGVGASELVIVAWMSVPQSRDS